MNQNKSSLRGNYFLSGKYFFSLLAVLLLSFSVSGCKYNDDDLWTEIGGIKQELESIKSQISSLQTIVDAINKGKSITDIKQTEKGYTITFNDGQTIEINHGTDGANAPEIGIALYEGEYYWTKGQGENNWLTDGSGNKIPVAGKDGATGNDGVTPKMKIEEGYWYVSVDNGTNWEKLGKATEDAESSFFTAVTHDENYAYFTLVDGTVIKIPMAVRLKIELSSTSLVMEAGKEIKVGYKLLNSAGDTYVEVISSEIIKAKVINPEATEGEISIYTNNLAAIDEYTKVVILATDDVRVAMATIAFDKEEGVLKVTETFEVSAEEQLLTIPVETNLASYEVIIEEAARMWLSQSDTKTRALRTEEEVFEVKANTTTEVRSAIVTITGGGIAHRVSVVQLAGSETPDPENPIVGNVELDKLYGYAIGTTGGEGATSANIFHFDNGTCFRDYLKLREKNKDQTPAIIYLSGKFTKNQGRDTSSPWFDIKDTHNLSIYGVDGFVMENVGFFLKRASNIIIRNIYIQLPKADNGADGISMQECNNVWVDHCTFESINQTKDYEDGSCDITHASYNVTVSWCHFIKTQKSCLVGHSNSATGDVKITATFHHNYFDLSSSRHPRVRYGRAHVYNNYFKEVTTYGVGSAYNAMVLVEDNYFDGVRLPIDICTFPAKPSGSSWVSNLTGSVAGYVYERGNTYANKPDNAGEIYPFTNLEYKAYNGEKLSAPYGYSDFKPTYDYIVDEADQIPAIVSSSAGIGKLPGYDKAPIEVNNGGMTPDPETPDPEDPQPGENDLGNGWKWISYGEATVNPAVTSGVLALEANGKFESGKQVFGYVYRAVTGDFVATVQLESYNTTSSSNQSLAGLLITPDFSATETNFLHCMAAQGPANGYYRSVRVAAGNASRGTLTAPSTVDESTKPVLKLERSGNECSISYSLDGGVTFGKARTEKFTALPENVYIGLAVNSGDSKNTATAVFSKMTLNGEPVSF